MTKRSKRDENTADLFLDHKALFPVETPREMGPAVDFNAAIAGAMARALDEARDRGADRFEVAKRMSLILNVDVSKGMLDAYTSQARETHTISLVRFKAFARATGCPWLWSVVLEGEGLTLLQGDEAIHAQISFAETRIRALQEDVKALKATAPLTLSRSVRR